MSGVLVGVQAAIALLHLYPPLVYPARPVSTTVVVFISDLGPWWLVAFGLSAVALIITLKLNRHRQYGHLACGAVWIAYSVALWWGVAATRGTVTLAVLATGWAALHLALATGYADRRD
jgi:hypothetical protein